jgi:ribosome biogenesis protein BRX1
MAAVYKALTNTSSKKPAQPPSSATAKDPRQRLLILTSRGVTHRQRHLLNDLAALLPHARKESKLDTKTRLHQLNELADLHSCNNVLFFEARKGGADLYAWLAKPPNGPTLKCHVQNLHTMDELRFAGNCLRGSRPMVAFDRAFDAAPHWRLIRELLLHSFGVPRGARRAKPFVDHVVGFTLADGRVWFRCYQICEAEAGGRAGGAGADAADAAVADAVRGELGDAAGVSLVEIGPRFVLTPIVVLEGGFGGPVIYENRQFVSPNQIRAELRVRKAGKHGGRVRRAVENKAKRDELGLATDGRRAERDPLDGRDLFA